MSNFGGKEKEGILEAPFYLSDWPKWWYMHKDWRQYCVCRLSTAPFTTTTPKGPSTAQQSLLSCFTDWTVKGQDHLQRSYQMFFSSINILMYLFCFGSLSLFFFFFLLSCADPVFPVLPALEWRHIHVCVPRLQQPLLFHSHLGSSHCWLMVGKIQVRTIGCHVPRSFIK